MADDFIGTQKMDVALSFLIMYIADEASSKVFIQRSVDNGQVDTSIALSPTLKLAVSTLALVDKLLHKRIYYSLMCNNIHFAYFIIDIQSIFFDIVI